MLFLHTNVFHAQPNRYSHLFVIAIHAMQSMAWSNIHSSAQGGGGGGIT